MAVDFPSTLYKEHIPLLISTIPTNKRQTPNIIFSPLLFFNISFCLYFVSGNILFNTHNANTYSTRETEIVKMQDVANLQTGSFFTILSEGATKQGLSTIPMDNKFQKTPILDFKGVTDYDTQRAYDNIKNEVKHIIKKHAAI